MRIARLSSCFASVSSYVKYLSAPQIEGLNSSDEPPVICIRQHRPGIVRLKAFCPLPPGLRWPSRVRTTYHTNFGAYCYFPALCYHRCTTCPQKITFGELPAPGGRRAPGALYGLPTARAAAGRLPVLVRTRDYFFARCWSCRRARPVARRVLCAAPDAALRVPCVVPVVVPLARFAVPDAAPCRTSRYPGAVSLAWRVWGWFGLQPSIPSELPTKRQVQMPLRIQIKRERFDDKPPWAPNFHPFSCSRSSA